MCKIRKWATWKVGTQYMESLELKERYPVFKSSLKFIPGVRPILGLEMSLPHIHIENGEEDSHAEPPLIPLRTFQRPRSRTVVEPGHFFALSQNLQSLFIDRHPRLQLSIPPLRGPEPPRTSPLTDGDTPQSEGGPETPVSEVTSPASPIAGVVDLTRSVSTTSAYAVAHGGLSDIFMGEWHRADDESGEVKKVVVVAIKVLRIMAKKDQDGVTARKRLNREVNVWHRLEHPNIAKFFGTSYHMSGRPAMVMQWYDNGSAAEYLANKNPGANRLNLILDVARGLAYLHTHKPPIVHADLKGNNVLITDEGSAALSDFGLSQVVEDLGRPTGFTLSNPDVGPLRWQAPEFLENDGPATLASDVWSFGCTAFELLTSTIPYEHRKRDFQVIRDMQEGIKPYEPTGSAFQALDQRVQSLLDSCWSFTPSERPTMSDIQAQLEAICAA